MGRAQRFPKVPGARGIYPRPVPELKNKIGLRRAGVFAKFKNFPQKAW
jgi:hypothetical protein